MIYTSLNLQTVGFIVGIALVAAHGIALLHAEGVRTWLRSMPRSRTIGTTLLTVNAAWAFALIATMDLGEFSNYRTALMVLIPVAYFLSLKFVDEFLAVRAFGMLLLLAAEPVLESAFLRPETSRLLLVVLAYAWAVLGMFYVGMPYLMRDQIGWWLKSDGRWRAGCFAGLAYGAAVLICSATQYR